MNTLVSSPNDTKFQEECKELLKIYKFKGYRRHGHILKALYLGEWKRECSLAEFVWNYCKSPQKAKALLQQLQNDLIDDIKVTSWVVKANSHIDAKITFMEMDEAKRHLKENASAPFVHLLQQGIEQAIDRPETGIVQIDYAHGDLFHGVLLDSEMLEDTHNIQFIFESQDSGEYQYIYYPEDIEELMYTIQEDSSEHDENDLYYVVPLFKHPIPLAHLEANNVKMYVRVVPNETSLRVPSDIEVFPVYSVLCDEYRQWFKERSLRLCLRDSDKLSIGPNKIKIIE